VALGCGLSITPQPSVTVPFYLRDDFYLSNSLINKSLVFPSLGYCFPSLGVMYPSSRDKLP